MTVLDRTSAEPADGAPGPGRRSAGRPFFATLAVFSSDSPLRRSRPYGPLPVSSRA